MVKSKPSVFVVVVEYNKYIDLFVIGTLLWLSMFYFKLNSFSFRQKKMVKYRQRKKKCLYLEKKVVKKILFTRRISTGSIMNLHPVCCFHHFKLSCKELSLEY